MALEAPLTQEDVRRFGEAVDKVSRMERAIHSGGTSNANFTLNAGAAGVWVATTCCLVMLGMVIVGAFWISSEFDRINSRFNDQTDTDSVQDAYIHKLRAEQKQEKR